MAASLPEDVSVVTHDFGRKEAAFTYINSVRLVLGKTGKIELRTCLKLNSHNGPELLSLGRVGLSGPERGGFFAKGAICFGPSPDFSSDPPASGGVTRISKHFLRQTISQRNLANLE